MAGLGIVCCVVVFLVCSFDGGLEFFAIAVCADECMFKTLRDAPLVVAGFPIELVGVEIGCEGSGSIIGFSQAFE